MKASGEIANVTKFVEEVHLHCPHALERIKMGVAATVVVPSHDSRPSAAIVAETVGTDRGGVGGWDRVVGDVRRALVLLCVAAFCGVGSSLDVAVPATLCLCVWGGGGGGWHRCNTSSRPWTA